jgi:hypothetical protein
VKSRFWTTFVAPKVAKGANARNGQRGIWYMLFVFQYHRKYIAEDLQNNRIISILTVSNNKKEI